MNLVEKPFEWIPLGLFLLLAFAGSASGQTINLSGEVAAQSFFFSGSPPQTQIGLRYIPSLDANRKISSKGSVGISVAANVFEALSFDRHGSYQNGHSFNWYRYWIRFAMPKYEIRLGNQKINFGPAKLFRSLMWFDRLDPRDPLQLTNGVKALLIRYYFLDNANIWLWGLVGNQGRKGIEFFQTAERKPEFGGRIQIPFITGQLALTTHHRWAKPVGFHLKSASGASLKNFGETRLAVDGSWDVGVGLWFESALFHYENRQLPFQWRQMATVGMDYTIPVGNGVYVMEENFIHSFSKTISHLENNSTFSGILLTYPLNLLDQIMAISTYDWKHEKFFHYVRWQRSTDKWQFNMSVFLIPTNTENWGNPALSAFSGNGFQVLVVYNY